MRFFSKRFNYIAGHLESLNASERISNRKLSRLIIDYNQVHYELIQINDFFKYQLGFNLISVYAIGLTLAFVVLLDIDWRLL